MSAFCGLGVCVLNNLFIESKKDIRSIIVHECTDVGRVYQNNEDYFGYHIPEDKEVKRDFGSLFVISDGVGGNAAGEVASAEAVNVLLQEYYFGKHTNRVPQRLKSAFQYTAMHIYDLSSNHFKVQSMKCTLSALLIKNDKFYIVHVGDSKIFLKRSKKMIQLTKDHSVAAKLLRLGLISKKEEKVHPGRHILLRALGDQPILPPDFYSGRISRGDLFCMITDGILEHQTEDELKNFLQKDSSKEGLENMIKEMNKRGGYDNMTIATIKINRFM